jgi:arsenate reductase
MQEIGIDISRQESKDIATYANEQFHYVITVCDRAKQQCPILPGAEPIHWGFDDPAEAAPDKLLGVFRRVRDEIRQRLNLFVLAKIISFRRWTFAPVHRRRAA